MNEVPAGLTNEPQLAQGDSDFSMICRLNEVEVLGGIQAARIDLNRSAAGQDSSDAGFTECARNGRSDLFNRGSCRQQLHSALPLRRGRVRLR